MHRERKGRAEGTDPLQVTGDLPQARNLHAAQKIWLFSRLEKSQERFQATMTNILRCPAL